MDSDQIAASDAGRIGAVLGAARTARGVELVDIARDTRVPVRHLAAIEADDHDHLPALPYAIGFVKAFARSVGIDPDVAATRFRAETSKGAAVPVPQTLAPLDERRLPPRGVVTASIAALVGVVALVAAWSAGVFDPPLPADPASRGAVTNTPPRVAPPPPAPAVVTPAVVTPAVVTPAPADTTSATTTGTTNGTPPARAGMPAGPAPAPAGPVVITATEDAWIKISVFDPAAGKVVAVKTGVLAKGERFVAPPTPGLRLWTGRAGALQVTVDGRAIPPLGGPVQTVKNVSLDAADLRARLAPPPAPGRAGPPVG